MRHMNPSQHTGDQIAVAAEGFPSRIVAKKAKVDRSAKKVMATVFYIDYPQKERTINDVYYSNL